MRCVLRPGYTWPPEQTLLEQTTLVSGITENKVFAEGSANVRGRKSVLPLQPAILLFSVPHCTGYRAAAEQAAEGLAAVVSEIPGSILAPRVTHLHPK